MDRPAEPIHRPAKPIHGGGLPPPPRCCRGGPAEPTQLDVVPYKRGCRASLAPPTPTHPHYTRSSCIRDHCHPRQAPPDRLRDHCHPLLHSPSRSPPLQHQYFERRSKMDQGGREDRGDVQDRYFPDLPLRILMGKP